MQIVCRINRLILMVITRGSKVSITQLRFRTSSNSQPDDCVSQTLTHARVIYPFSEDDKPRLLNVIVLPSVSRVPWEIKLCSTWIAFDERVYARCIVTEGLVAIIHSRPSRVREGIDYSFTSILFAPISHRDPNERINRETLTDKKLEMSSANTTRFFRSDKSRNQHAGKEYTIFARRKLLI